MPQITAYLILDNNCTFPGTTTFDRQFANASRNSSKVYKLGTFTADKITRENGLTAITHNNQTHDTAYSAIHANTPWASDLPPHWHAYVTRYANEPKPHGF